jgi:hypothetical protein
MPGRTPRGLREAITQYTPHLLTDFEEDWQRSIATSYNLAAAPAFVARWWELFAIERDPALAAVVANREERAAETADLEEAHALLSEVSRIKRRVARLEPGE